uniref:Uncharacterized protein n=1 Tax=Moniliophthora roreri TaxID=221103 RepID=A0A0W0FTX8_MONRR
MAEEKKLLKSRPKSELEPEETTIEAMVPVQASSEDAQKSMPLL